MTIYRNVSVRMHGDAKYRRLSKPAPNGQSLWFYLLTGDHTGPIPGLFKAGEASLAEALEWPLEGFRQAFAEVSALGMAKADWRARLVWLPKAVFHNPPQSLNVVKAWRKAFDELPECSLKIEAFQVFRAYLDGKPKAFGKAFGEALPKAIVDGMAYPESGSEAGSGTESEARSEAERSQRALFKNGNSNGRKPRSKKANPYRPWIEDVLKPAMPKQSRCQDEKALTFLSETKPSEAQLAEFVREAEAWTPVWISENWFPGLKKFLSESKYRGGPPEPIRTNGDVAHRESALQTVERAGREELTQ